MILNNIDIYQYPALQDKEPDFQVSVCQFASRLATLSEVQKKKLAILKAIKLTNAIVQIYEKEQSPLRIGKEKAKVSFRIVRAALREQRISLPGQAEISLREPELRSIIDEACCLFHSGKKDPNQWEQRLALSTAQCIVLNHDLMKGLRYFHQRLQDLSPPEILSEVAERFIVPYAA
ncbi:MAG: hypothetical protein KME16_13855 [Scytolyngbya sp. HA4215-MV1]|nr:hypothetical protein [Scytolyngbya sp. HA4215-MV1]